MTDKLRTAFDGVKASPELKENTLRYLETQREKRRPRRTFRLVAAAACAALLLLFGAWQILRVPVSYVSIDVNPSVELGLNRLDRIVSACAYNDDGALVLDGLSLRGKLYTEAIELLLDSDAMSPYLNENSALTFTVAANGPEKESALLTAIENTHCCRKYSGESCGADLSTLLEAHSYGLSFGKFAAYQALAEYDSTVTPEDCHGMTMGEIHQRIRQHQHGNHSAGQEPAAPAATPAPGTVTIPIPTPAVSPASGEHHGDGNGNGMGNGAGSGNGECKEEEHEEEHKEDVEECQPEDCAPEPGPAETCSGDGMGSGNGNGNGSGNHHGSGHHGE